MSRAALLLGLLLALSARAAGGDLAAAVVIVANTREPESVALANFYAAERHVPSANIVALPLPLEEIITWRQFIAEVEEPLQDELFRRGWLQGMESTLRDRLGRRRYAFFSHRIAYLVVCRGVPLRIQNDAALLPTPAKLPTPFERDESAVDSELSLLATANYDIVGPRPNPTFELDGPVNLDAAQVVKVSRLDGPTWENARHLVTSAIEAERVGLHGRAYIDLGGPHAAGDDWLRAAAKTLREAGFATEVESTPATFAADAVGADAVFYLGWYAQEANGPFASPDFHFPPGAIAEHIHSFSAQTLHSATTGWSGPLIARGVTATVGNVFEPDLKFTHRPDLLVRALLRGENFGDAAYYALPGLSWQAIALGDPLYRPFPARAADTKKPAENPPAKVGAHEAPPR